MQVYQSWDFCHHINCTVLEKSEVARKNLYCLDCRAYQMHDYLQEQGLILDEKSELKEQIEQREKALEMACNFMAEEFDGCFWNISGKVANGYGGYDCDLCHRYPIEKCTREYFMMKAKEGGSDD